MSMRMMNSEKQIYRRSVILFIVRFVLYLFAFAVPLFHPAIAVSYDITGWITWFMLVPSEMLIAFLFRPKRRATISTSIFAVVPVLAVSVFLAGSLSDFLLFLIASAGSFLSTMLVFRSRFPGLPSLIPEQFFLCFVYYRLLGFSRSSESIAHASGGINRFLFALILIAFVVHSFVLFAAAFQSRRGQKPVRGKKEALIFGSIGVFFLTLVLFILPSDFVEHSAVVNLLENKVIPQPIPLDSEGRGIANGNLRPWDRFKGQGEEGGNGEAKLEGIPSESWGQGTGPGGQERQYAVMVVASPMDPTYLAGSYFEYFDPKLGFQPRTDQELNNLSKLRLIETWKDTKSISDRLRIPVPVFTVSTLSERYLAYRPFSVEPTTMNKTYYPFSFSFNAVSRMSIAAPEQLLSSGRLTEKEQHDLKPYLEVPLEENDRRIFESYLGKTIKAEMVPYEKIDAIVKSFSEFKYFIGFADDVSVQNMTRFLTETKEGDCTEFSNTSAVLARLAGIPARVVTGYLASSGLQTEAHIRGLVMLRQAVELLKAFPLEELFLVTTAHRHSWVQVYLSGFGWLDIETTAHAIPPVGLGDPNKRNVVIPLIQAQKERKSARPFPWKILGFFLLAGGAAIAAGIYAYRYGREAWYAVLSKRRDIQGAIAMQRLLLLKLAAYGFRLKSPAETMKEFAAQYPIIGRFADIYTELRYRERLEREERERMFDDLSDEFRKCIAEAKNGRLVKKIRYIFNLRGLRRQW